MRLLDADALEAEKGIRYSRMQLWRLVREGKFPAPLKIGSKNFWLEQEVEALIERRIRERDGEPEAA